MEFEPEAIIHLGECSSDPYSVIDRKHTVFAQVNNLTTTFNLLFAVRDLAPHAHLVKLGTLPGFNPLNADIPEGYCPLEHGEREDLMSFPAPAPDSMYARVQDLGNSCHGGQARRGLRYSRRGRE